jgi:phage gp29-like protein
MWPFSPRANKTKPVALDPRVSADATAKVAERQADPDPSADRAPIAPYPVIDRSPTILGSNVSLAYISSVFRLCITGYRREYCDLLDELLERDPHCYAVVAQRVQAIAGGRIQVIAAKTEPGSDDETKAEEIRQYVDNRIHAIPDLQQALAYLQWGGLYYGVGAAEINWRKDDDGWYPARLHWIHSRRLAYPDPFSWAVRIWDQGSVSSWDAMADPTAQLFGVKVDDFPGKFIVHAPAVRGNYPTRDGLGREVAYWSALKLMGARGAAQYIERFGKPWTIGYYTTGDDGKPRSADDEDIKAVDAATKALGVGSLAAATLPDSTKVDVFGPASAAPGRQLMHAQFVALCNAEMSKAVLGQTDTTEAGPNGSRSSTETRKKGTYELYRSDSSSMADTLERGLVKWLVRLNFPEAEHLVPRITVHATEEPDPDAILERAVKAAEAGAEVDADETCEQAGVALVPQQIKKGEKTKPRRLYPMAQLKPYEIQTLDQYRNGEVLMPPPHLVDPFAEGGPGMAGSSDAAQGAAGKPGAKPQEPKAANKAADTKED